MPILLSSFYFFYFAIVGVYIIFMPKVLVMSGFSASEIGIIFAAGPLVRFLLPFILAKGVKIDRGLFNIALLLAMIGSFGIYISLANFFTLLISNIFLGIGMSVILPYMEVISLESIGKQSYGKVRLFGSVGFVLIALVLVKFLSSAQIALNYLLLSVFCTVVTAFIIVKISHAKEKEQEETQNDISLLQYWRKNMMIIDDA